MPWEAPARLQLGVYRGSGRSLGIYTGAGLACATYDERTFAQQQRRAGVFAEIGVALAAIPHLRLEVGLPVGAGLVSRTSDGVSDNHSGGYVEIGAVARPILEIGHGMVFLEVGYLAGGAAIAGVNEGGSATDDSGVFLALGVGINP